MTAILVADNDPDINELLGHLLRSEGCRVDGVRDGEAALARIHQGGIDWLVCDLDMPRLDGLGLLQRLAEQLPSPPRTIVISGYLDAAIEERLRDFPFVESSWRKPFDILEFASALGVRAGADGGR